MHHSTRHLLQFFSHAHLPEKLAMVAKPFTVMAFGLAAQLPENPETTAALRKLLEAKDCAVRAMVAE